MRDTNCIRYEINGKCSRCNTSLKLNTVNGSCSLAPVENCLEWNDDYSACRKCDNNY